MVSSIVGFAALDSGWFDDFRASPSLMPAEGCSTFVEVGDDFGGEIGVLSGTNDGGDDDLDLDDLFQNDSIARAGKATLALAVIAFVLYLFGLVSSALLLVKSNALLFYINLGLIGGGNLFQYSSWVTFTYVWIREFCLDPSPSWAWANMVTGSAFGFIGLLIFLVQLLIDKVEAGSAVTGKQGSIN
eukprot:CAMPEP_0201556842 /NCGR_PEP_ID=MMETSP0173_2-20130828/58021_1 /ASSEMBLY_ACC=CAM_ASM_000268 /TAXON_ID=218659 /ORGANISM="Vexillifera sp., Strain DIVA3 564/2" /LENGTH=186 /DNA_ID=CAMNT_0047969359 /DNA_START=137 /DNA_END=697 /DNA_ORIENTATION=-